MLMVQLYTKTIVVVNFTVYNRMDLAIGTMQRLMSIWAEIIDG
jgi:hypothetical protein